MSKNILQPFQINYNFSKILDKNCGCWPQVRFKRNKFVDAQKLSGKLTRFSVSAKGLQIFQILPISPNKHHGRLCVLVYVMAMADPTLS